MQGKGLMMMRVLMNRYHQGAPASFLAALPEGVAKGVIEQDIVSQDPSQAIIKPLELFKGGIHYSWLIPALKKMPKTMRSLLISSLPKDHAEVLSTMTASSIVNPPSPPVQNFLFGLLYQKLNYNNVLPPSFLPETPLTPLLNFSKPQLIELIDYLSLYDLSQELRQIVDKNIINAINNALPPIKQRFLKMCLHQKEKVSTAKMGLKDWKGDSERLATVLHRRGLMRLGGALSGQNAGLVWHIVHRLDSGRGVLLEKSCRENEIPGASSVLTQQVLNVINFIKKAG